MKLGDKVEVRLPDGRFYAGHIRSMVTTLRGGIFYFVVWPGSHPLGKPFYHIYVKAIEEKAA